MAQPRAFLCPDTVAQRLMQAMLARGLTQQQVSLRAGIAESTLSSILSGRRHGWRLPLDVAERLARQLFISMDYLVGWWPEELTPPVPSEAPPARGRERGQSDGCSQ
jgi:transcriptional regulator with XRE-family HTH domain